MEQRIKLAVAKHQDKIDQIRDLTMLAIREDVRLEQTVAHVALATLSHVQHEIDAARYAGRLTPHKEQALYHYREAYKHELLDVVDRAHQKVYRLLERLK
jgi:hypothetical protein